MKLKYKLNKNSEEYKKLLDEFFLPKNATQVELIDSLVSRLIEMDTSIDVDSMKLITVQRRTKK